ncbi:MAG: PorV/PorQ family protein [Elusimicrobiota bacterium]
MRAWALVVLLFASVPAARAASFNRAARGTAGAAFLKLRPGARPIALGEAYAAMADDAEAIYWNPAALTRILSRSAAFTHASHLNGSFSEYGACGMYLGGGSSLGAGFQYFSAGSMIETDDAGIERGSFTPSDLALSFAYAYKLRLPDFPVVHRGALGVGVKYIRSSVVDTAQTAAVDIGLLSRVYGDQLRLAFTATNIGGSLKFEEEGSALPAALRFGGTYRMHENWLAALDVELPRDNGPVLGLGTEYAWEVEKGWLLAGRVGLNTRTLDEVDGLSGLSLGFGSDYRRTGFDYAFLPFGDLGASHRLTFSYLW